MSIFSNLSKGARIGLAVGAAGAASAIGVLAVPATFGGFTAATSNPGNSVSAGTVKMTNSVGDGSALTFTGTGVYSPTNLAPGHSVSGPVEITNSGSLPATTTLSIGSVTIGGTACGTSPNACLGDYHLKIVDDEATPATVFDATLANTSAPISLTSSEGNATWAANDHTTYTVTVTLNSAAGNEAQGSSASFALNWGSASV
jgi:spore coat-associated protein N